MKARHVLPLFLAAFALAAHGGEKVIKNGDTLGGIAKKFHCTVKQLKQWNGLKNDNIRAGKKLKICK